MSNIYRKRTNSNDQFDIDAKVYIGNVPTDHLTDQELLQFFKPFGKISGFTNKFHCFQSSIFL